MAWSTHASTVRSFSIAIGPVLGGALASSLGFRAIFVFLLIISSVVLLAIIVFLPETLRTIAGNGSLKLSGIHRPLIHLVTRPKNQEEPEEPLVRKKVTISTFTDPLKLLAQRDILFNLIFGGVIYTVWSMVTASTTGLFKSVFGLNDLQVGFAFLPNGLGTIVGSAVVGNLMTNDFKDAEVKYKMLYNLPTEYKLPAKNIPVDFPIERTRLRHLPWISVLFTASTALYGFSLSLPNLTTRVGWVAAPLLLQFLIAAASNAVFALNQTIVSDLCPGKGASSSAINNLVRCGLGAVGVALIDGMLGAFGSATTFLGLALIVVACVPIMVVNWYWGTDWRALREQEKIVDQVKR
jgi:MFS family permease